MQYIFGNTGDKYTWYSKKNSRQLNTSFISKYKEIYQFVLIFFVKHKSYLLLVIEN